MRRCLPWFFRTEPESEDFAYWDDDGMKVLHCDHAFELRSQESSLLLHQEGQGRRSSLIVCFASYRKGCHVALHEGSNWNFASFMHHQLSMKRFCHVIAHHVLDLLGHFFFAIAFSPWTEVVGEESLRQDAHEVLPVGAPSFVFHELNRQMSPMHGVAWCFCWMFFVSMILLS